VIAYRRGERSVFLFGFAKSERANLDDRELAEWQQIGRSYLGLDDCGLDTAIAIGTLMEVSYGEAEEG